jgi:3-oxoacyl-[acyl-carrier-protein] synthase-3
MLPELDRNVAILGVGGAVPERRVTNEELRGLITGYDDESGDFSAWVDRVTHIQERRFADPAIDGVAQLSLESCRQAIESSGVDPSEIDQVILCSFTFEDLYPGVHAWLVPQLGLDCGAIILTGACSGSLWGLTYGRSLVQSGQCRNVLVIGAECISRAMDFTDPLTAILFADAAGAVVIGRTDGTEDVGFVGKSVLKSEFSNDSIMMTNCNAPPGQRMDATSPRTADRQYIRMAGGPRVLRNAVNRMAASVVEVLGHTMDDLKNDDPELRETLSRVRLIPHQANGRIIDGMQSKLGLGEDQVYRTVYIYGNSSAATNLITYDYGCREGNLRRLPPPEGVEAMGTIEPCGRRIEKGDLVVLTAIGAGYLYGSVAFVQAF